MSRRSFFDRCGSCHRPGGIGPFALLSYADVVPAAAPDPQGGLQAGSMPPWKPEYGHGEFTDERRLPESQKRQAAAVDRAGCAAGRARARASGAALHRWLATGAAGPRRVNAGGLRSPSAAGPDIFRNFVVAFAHDRRRYVRAWEFRPGNSRAVHHATIGFDRTRASRELDAGDGAPGYEGVVPFSVANPDGYFLGWSPGQRQPQRALPRMPWSLQASGDVMFSMHLRPTGRRERVAASLGLYFTDDAPEGAPVTLRLGRQDIDIPAGRRGTRHLEPVQAADRRRAPLGIPACPSPRSRDSSVGSTSGWQPPPLLLISNWDFNWQDVYRYAAPVSLPAGPLCTCSTPTTTRATGHTERPAATRHLRAEQLRRNG